MPPARHQPDQPGSAGVALKRDVDALIKFIDSRQQRRHRYGRKANDCVGYALAAVEAQTGVKVAPQHTWSSRAEALRMLAAYGSIEAAFDAFFERIAPAQAMRGDIAGVPDEFFGLHPAIVEGPTLVSPGPTGNQRLKRTAMTCAWSAVRQRSTALPHTNPSADGRKNVPMKAGAR